MEFKKYTLRNSTEIFIKADDKLRVGCEVYTKLGDGEMALLQEPTNFLVNITLRVVDGKVSSITSWLARDLSQPDICTLVLNWDLPVRKLKMFNIINEKYCNKNYGSGYFNPIYYLLGFNVSLLFFKKSFKSQT